MSEATTSREARVSVGPVVNEVQWTSEPALTERERDSRAADPAGAYPAHREAAGWATQKILYRIFFIWSVI